MFNSGLQRPKIKIAVQMHTFEGEVLEGNIFVNTDQRMKDLMNGDDMFIAFENLEGEVQIINKRAIARVKPLERRRTSQAA